MEEVFIASAVRTPILKFGGALKHTLASDLALFPVKEVLRQTAIDPGALDDVVFGNCFMRSDDINTARCTLLKAGIPVHVPGVTIQRQCASSMQALVYAAQQIQTGSAQMVLVGGVEVMSSSLYVSKDARWGKRLQHSQLVDALWEGLADPLGGYMMGVTAENLAEKYAITREEQDLIALRSNLNAAAASKSGRFRDEIVPIVMQERKKELVIDSDDHFRDDVTLEELAKLPALFKKGGTVTAGNASGLNDGAAAVLVLSAEACKQHGVTPIARLVGHAVAGVEPELMGYGPVPATRKALERAGMRLEEIDLVELNEAFAAQYLACEKGLGLNREITNVNGSGIGLGHPVGATGLRMVVSLVHELKRRGKRYGLATLCVGGGMGKTTIWESV